MPCAILGHPSMRLCRGRGRIRRQPAGRVWVQRLVANKGPCVRRWTVSMCRLLSALLAAVGITGAEHAADRTLNYYPVGPIYEYRWKVLELALDHVRQAEGATFDL